MALVRLLQPVAVIAIPAAMYAVGWLYPHILTDMTGTVTGILLAAVVAYLAHRRSVFFAGLLGSWIYPLTTVCRVDSSLPREQQLLTRWMHDIQAAIIGTLLGVTISIALLRCLRNQTFRTTVYKTANMFSRDLGRRNLPIAVLTLVGSFSICAAVPSLLVFMPALLYWGFLALVARKYRLILLGMAGTLWAIPWLMATDSQQLASEQGAYLSIAILLGSIACSGLAWGLRWMWTNALYKTI